MEQQKKTGNPSAIVGLLVVIALGVGGYFFFQQRQGPPVSPEMKAAQQEVLKNCKFDADFCRYAANAVVAMAKGYTMTSASTYGGKKTVMIIKNDGKSNTQSTTMVDGKEEGGFITLDKITYMKSPGEKEWIEYPPAKEEGQTEKQGLFDVESFKKEMTDLTDETKNSLVVKKVGSERCGAYTCSIFEMKESTMNTTSKVWIDTREYLARKMEFATKEGTSTMTFDYGPVIITKPSPVKKMPSFEDTLKDSGVNMSSEEIQNLMKNIPQEAPVE